MLFRSSVGSALLAGNLPQAERLIRLCAKTTGASGLRQRAVERVGIERLPIDVRIGLAQMLSSQDVGEVVQAFVARLLDLPPEALPAVLRCTVPVLWKTDACCLAIGRTRTMGEAAIRALARQPEVLCQALSRVVDPTSLAGLVAAYEPCVVLDILAANTAIRSQIDVDAVVENALKSGVINLSQLATIESGRYWGMLLCGHHAESITHAILNESVLQPVAQATLACMRAAIGATAMSVPVVRALRGRADLLETLLTPSLPIVRPGEIIAALTELPRSDRYLVILQLLPRLLRSIRNESPQVCLRHLLVVLEKAVPQEDNKPVTALRELAKVALASGQLLADATVATGFVAYAFGVLGHFATLAADRDQLVDLGVELVDLYARAGGPLLNRQVNEQALCWPEPARTMFRLARQRRRINGTFLATLARSHAALTQ